MTILKIKSKREKIYQVLTILTLSIYLTDGYALNLSSNKNSSTSEILINSLKDYRHQIGQDLVSKFSLENQGETVKEDNFKYSTSVIDLPKLNEMENILNKYARVIKLPLNWSITLNQIKILSKTMPTMSPREYMIFRENLKAFKRKIEEAHFWIKNLETLEDENKNVDLSKLVEKYEIFLRNITIEIYDYNLNIEEFSPDNNCNITNDYTETSNNTIKNRNHYLDCLRGGESKMNYINSSLENLN